MDQEELISAAMREIASRRKPTTHTCQREGCGKQFKGLHRSRYCSPACKTAAYRARRKEREKT